MGETPHGAEEQSEEEGAAETVNFSLISQHKHVLALPFSLLVCHFAGKHDP